MPVDGLLLGTDSGGSNVHDGSGRQAVTATTLAVDTPFVTAVHAALSARVRSIVEEAAGERAGWDHLEHRALAERVKALVAAWCSRSDGDDTMETAELLGPAATLMEQLQRRQGPHGLFTGGDNVDSPPDTAFSINDLADALLMLRRAGGPPVGDPAHPPASRLADLLDQVLAAATPALRTGGVHTPNHRWELSAALARLHRLSPDATLVARAEQWLAEGVDIDADGLYSERSPNYAAHVSNPSLLILAEVLHRPDLVDVVERNLLALLDLLLPDGTVETVMSRRQDQFGRAPLAGHLLPLRQVARLRSRGDLSWAAGLALAQGVHEPAAAAALLVLDPDAGLVLPSPVVPPLPRRRHFREAGLLIDRQAAATVVVFGGSDHPRLRVVRSGLANSPTFLRLFAGAAVLDSARLSRTFFGHGPFRSTALDVEAGDDGAGGTILTLRETLTSGYYQPLAAADRDPQGRYLLGDEGRFSAAMDFGRRVRDEVTLTTQVRAHLLPAGVELTLDLDGPAVDWALELAFLPGGTLTGARPLTGTATGRRALTGKAWHLSAAPGAGQSQRTAHYRVGDDGITVTLLAASDGRGGHPAPARTSPSYEPGEEYGYVGGTDAATGERLYISARVPARVQICLTADSVPSPPLEKHPTMPTPSPAHGGHDR